MKLLANLTRDVAGDVHPGSHSALVSALISPVVSGEEDAPGGHDGVAPPPDHGDAGPRHWG